MLSLASPPNPISPSDLKAHRHRLGLSQFGLALAVGVHPQCISRWERGLTRIPGPVARLMTMLPPKQNLKAHNQISKVEGNR